MGPLPLECGVLVKGLELNKCSLFGKPDLLVTNRQVYPGTKNANPPLSSRHGSLFSVQVKKCVDQCASFSSVRLSASIFVLSFYL